MGVRPGKGLNRTTEKNGDFCGGNSSVCSLAPPSSLLSHVLVVVGHESEAVGEHAPEGGAALLVPPEAHQREQVLHLGRTDGWVGYKRKTALQICKPLRAYKTLQKLSCKSCEEDEPKMRGKCCALLKSVFHKTLSKAQYWHIINYRRARFLLKSGKKAALFCRKIGNVILQQKRQRREPKLELSPTYVSRT